MPSTAVLLLPLLLLKVIIILTTTTTITTTEAYRVRQVVGLWIRTPAETVDALRYQMPLFGVDTTTSLLFNSNENERDRTRTHAATTQMSLAFQDGARALPWVDLHRKKGRNELVSLQKLVVTFYYSHEGGVIHSVVLSKILYVDSDLNSKREGQGEQEIEVEYKWIEEGHVDPNGGANVMFLAVFLASMVFLVHALGTSTNTSQSSNTIEGQQRRRRLQGGGAGGVGSGSGGGGGTWSSGSVPKWD